HLFGQRIDRHAEHGGKAGKLVGARPDVPAFQLGHTLPRDAGTGRDDDLGQVAFESSELDSCQHRRRTSTPTPSQRFTWTLSRSVHVRSLVPNLPNAPPAQRPTTIAAEVPLKV